jgi:hypothetical protein
MHTTFATAKKGKKEIMNENEYESADEVDEVESSEEEVAVKKKRRVKKWKVCCMCGFLCSHVEGFSILLGIF